MKRWLSRQVDGLLDRLAERVARRAVQQYFFVELHPSTILLREAQAEAAAYVRERMPGALYFIDRENLLRYALDQVAVKGQVLEFGVFAGKTIRTIAGRVQQPVHGFDTFTGLPEDWAGSKSPKGEFSLGGRLPAVPANVTLHPGLFEATLPGFVREHRDPVAFAHVDCDLYSSTRTVFEAVGPLVVPGTVLLFDDYFNYPGWRQGEHLAFQEWVKSRGVKYRYIGYARHQAAVVIEDVG
jgi:hypothetical protein